jgi:UDPglucose 6-dehydrogenase
LTFKPETDDLRDSPALDIIAELEARGATIRAYDPKGMDGARAVLETVTFCADPYDAARGASAVAIITEWAEFRSLDLARLRAAVRIPVLVDLRSVLDAATARQHGFAYHAVGVAAPIVADESSAPTIRSGTTARLSMPTRKEMAGAAVSGR